MDRLRDINSTLTSQLSRLRNIQNTVQETENLAEQARGRVEDTEDLIAMASDMLEKAKMAAGNVVSVLCRSMGRGEGRAFPCWAVWLCFSAFSHCHSKFAVETSSPYWIMVENKWRSMQVLFHKWHLCPCWRKNSLKNLEYTPKCLLLWESCWWKWQWLKKKYGEVGSRLDPSQSI